MKNTTSLLLDGRGKAVIGGDWEESAAARYMKIEQRIPQDWRLPEHVVSSCSPIRLLSQDFGFLTEKESWITGLRAIDLLGQLQSGSLKATEVTLAFCKRAAIAHQVTNCLAEVYFDEALCRAAELDSYFLEHGTVQGPLHGLPISVKEHIKMKNTTVTCGLIAWANELTTEDALIVKTFRDQGAIFHVKTTNPQSLMMLETESNLFGRTLNPYNINLTSGGSTGGEGALLAMHGSVIGIGTDIGGSIRVPSAFCGVYGFKPSVGRMPHSGLSGLHDGMQNIIGCIGPLARCLDDMKLFCKAALNDSPWKYEPAVIEAPWKDQVCISERLKIGMIWSDGVVFPHPPVTRILQEIARKAKQAQHEIFDWDTTSHEDIYHATNRAYFLDGGKEYFDKLREGAEPPVDLLKWLLESQTSPRCSLEESWRVNQRLDHLRFNYLKQWVDLDVDFLICPASPSVASAHNESRYWGYTCVFNALDYSVITLPVGTVQNTDTWTQFPPPTQTPLTAMDQWYRDLYAGNTGPQKYRDAPISVQIVARRLQEEKVLEFARVIEELMTSKPTSSCL